MRKSVASFAHTFVAALMAAILTFSMAPFAWADDGPAGTIAGTVAGSAAEPDGVEGSEGAFGSEVPTSPQPPSDPSTEASAEMQSVSTKAAEGSSAGGTTVSIAVYRSSFPIAKWDLNDNDFNLTKAVWDNKPADSALPQQGSPGSEVAWPESGKPAGYKEPTRAGFEFAGWSADKSASSGGFIDGTAPILTMPEGAPDAKEYTLYALWTPNEYAVVFDLSKNPEKGEGPGDDASYDLKWATSDGVRTVDDLGGGRFRVSGFTMKEDHYDPTTRTVRLPEPARSGYRFLGWAEPDGQSLVMDNATKDGFAMNPVRLTQIDGTPALTARWTSAFGVTAPLSITFGDYDKTGAPGNPWLGDKDKAAADDSTQSEADDTTKPEQEGYQALGQAYFENTGWHDAVKLVGLTSTRHANANQVLTTYDTSKASEADVHGDGTEENPGERLLSLYPSATAPADKSSGTHFRLTDALSEAVLGDSFSMGAKGSGSEKLPVSYGLNLATDPVDNSANHGLVLPTNDYERKQIATVSYTFATADATAERIPEALWTSDDDGSTLGLYDIKADALAIAAGDAEKTAKYTRWLQEDHRFYVRWYDKGAVEAPDAAATIYEVRLIGVLYDSIDIAGTSKTGLTFQFVDLMNTGSDSRIYRFNNVATSNGGWFYSEMRRKMNRPGTGHADDHGDRSLDGVILDMVPAALQQAMQPVIKHANNAAGPNTASFTSVSYMTEKLFLVSYAEIATTLYNAGYFTDTASTFINARPFDGTGKRMSRPYDYYVRLNVSGTNQYAELLKGEQRYRQADGTYSICTGWFQRDTYPGRNDIFKGTNKLGDATNVNYNSAQPAASGICPAFCL